MKKITTMAVLLLTLLVSIFPTVASAESKTTIGITSVYTDRATTIELAVFIDSSERVAGGSLDLKYDNELLSITDANVETGEVLEGYLKSSLSDTEGTVSTSFAAAQGKMLTGDVLTIKARVSKAKADTEIKIENAYFYTEDGKELPLQIVNGAVKPFDGTTKDHPTTVLPNKVWTITLSEPYDIKTLNKHAVNVSRGTTNVPVKVKSISPTTFEVFSDTNYSKGNHTLEITGQLLSAKGTKLVEPVRKTFNVK
ncbi:hypothetical protein CSV80_05830 [Sporosarcina sp. P12(2017)]|uniref:cohesin domain-containing protein n=1 Tax=unclassified Sporosarcina TaxID=2647733 RepID=UPI000C172481|nr:MULTISPECIES: cohesin domain-containing protein [unclassified Sporosarcina]PIC58296.1 hypothetical protein CSV81_03900 [Sporosarcina sp. P10]PIC61539.1 hypothetical protein CSV80_05830 [Sporosarcina sp. P12(2017)]